MRKRCLVLALVVLTLAAIPLSASQFISMPFDQMSRRSFAVVRGTMGPVTSAWDADHEIIYSTAQLQISDYIAGEGAFSVTIREVGGTVAGYTQQAIGFPMLREGEDVVLFLTRWEDSSDARIEAYAQGKYLVRQNLRGETRVKQDSITQGDDARSERAIRSNSLDQDEGMSLGELRNMVGAARRAAAGQRLNQ